MVRMVPAATAFFHCPLDSRKALDLADSDIDFPLSEFVDPSAHPDGGNETTEPSCHDGSGNLTHPKSGPVDPAPTSYSNYQCPSCHNFQETLMLPNARFNDLLADIEPSPTTKDQASKAHTAVRNHLRNHVKYKNRWLRDFLAGSYTRDTAIRPRKIEGEIERPDVDTIIVTNHSTSDAPDDVLQELADALADGFTVERINKRSVRVVTANAEIDVVPVVEDGEQYQLPDRDLGHWKATNPPKHTTWSSEQNEDFDGRFKPLVKMHKWFRRENKTGKRPKGFVLEVLTSLNAPRDEKHWGEAFAQMLEQMHENYGANAQAGFKPFIEDPAIPGSDIMSKVSITDWKAFMEKVRVHAGYARRAQEEEDDEEATRLWRKIFGDRFPSGAKAVKSENLARVATVAPAAAVGTGFQFPDRNAAPTAPRSFA